ncbi:MAG: hypothetical protein LBQ47_06585 [Endomicrobium sp.]|jgi:hypothetical protein|nr:hypothetical protein [Endomicrobium sp.]
MKKFISCAVMSALLAFLCPLIVLSQETSSKDDENLEALEAARQERLEEYGEKKAELELQLAKLVKDRKIAANDKNSALENKRAFEILDVRKQLKALNKEYEIDAQEPEKQETAAKVSDKKKADPEIDIDFYAKEFEREKLKMEGGNIENSQTAAAPVKKKAPAKKKAFAKKKK